MCGILGIFNTDPVFEWRLLEAGRDTMIARGPDSAGSWRSGPLGLAHRRLSILDLSPGGHQPMRALEGQVVIVFNGEIYNHVEIRVQLAERGHAFESKSDTEILLKAYLEWGRDCVSHLNGAFAFAIADQRRQEIFLARDRAGEKPLFYFQDGTSFRFASELKALLADTKLPRRIQRDALDCYLTMGYVPGRHCILDGFCKLPPAHAAIFDLNTRTFKSWRYWDLPEVETPTPSVDELYAEFEGLFENAVRRQLAADVPVGILLSGGVDSSLVTAFAARHRNRLDTYTVAFPDQPCFDETVHSQIVAKHFDTNHTVIEARSQSATLVPVLARQFDEPVADSSMLPTFLVTEAVRRHCAVALGGDGGDELFGGYKNYSKALQVEGFKRILPKPLLAALAGAAGALLPVGMRGRIWLQYLGRNSKTTLLAPHFETALRRSLMTKQAPWPLSAEKFQGFPGDLSDDVLQRLTRADFHGYLPEDILVKVDRASMLNSLEVRAPLLDHKIIEFAFKRIPSGLKASPKDRKIFLKKIAARQLPQQFNLTRKQGFSIPIGEWLQKGAFRDLFQDVLYDRDCLFDRGVIDKLFSGLEHRQAHGERLYALALFELWRKSYEATL